MPLRSRVATVILVSAAAMFAAQPDSRIKLDQAGYLPNAPKVAVIAGAEAAADFTVRQASDATVAFRGKLSEPATDSNSGDRVQIADFSAVRQEGEYYIEAPGAGRSWQFSI